MVAWMRILVFVFVSIFVFSPSSLYAIEPDLNSTMAPGADNESVTTSESVKFPPAHSSIGSSPTGTGNRRNLTPLVWSFSYLPSPVSSPDDSCDPSTVATQSNSIEPTPEVGPALQGGVLRHEVLRNRNTGEIVRQAYACYIANVTGNFISTPPSFEDIWRAIYQQAFNGSATSSGAFVAPRSPGLTGLPTNIWAQFPDGQELTRVVTFPGGYVLNASIFISEVSIFTRDDQGSTRTLATLNPNASGRIDGGSFEAPASVYRFRTTGIYEISTGIVWTGRNTTLSGPGISTISIPIGSVRLEINREYRVGELNSAIVK